MVFYVVAGRIEVTRGGICVCLQVHGPQTPISGPGQKRAGRQGSLWQQETRLGWTAVGFPVPWVSPKEMLL